MRFENDVKAKGTKHIDIMDVLQVKFENDVKAKGTKQLQKELPNETGLRMM